MLFGLQVVLGPAKDGGYYLIGGTTMPAAALQVSLATLGLSARFCIGMHRWLRGESQHE